MSTIESSSSRTGIEIIDRSIDIREEYFFVLYAWSCDKEKKSKAEKWDRGETEGSLVKTEEECSDRASFFLRCGGYDIYAFTDCNYYTADRKAADVYLISCKCALDTQWYIPYTDDGIGSIREKKARSENRFAAEQRYKIDRQKFPVSYAISHHWWIYQANDVPRIDSYW